jgi:hypothetical protein
MQFFGIRRGDTSDTIQSNNGPNSNTEPNSTVELGFTIDTRNGSPSALWVQVNCETIFLEKWLTHLRFGFDGRRSDSGSGASFPQ